MKLDIAIGLVTVILAVLGGAVSAHAPSDKKHKIAYMIGFGVLGLLAVVLIWVQAARSERAATQSEERQRELAKDVKSATDDLSDTRKMLLDSRLDQAHMRGQLDALQLMASKIGDNSSTNMREIVGAINKMSEGGRVHPLTNKQLCDRAMAWAKRVREFATQKLGATVTLVEWQQQSKEIREAKSEEEKQAIWNRHTQEQVQRYQQFDLEFKQKFLGEALFLRDEMLKRVPSAPEPSGMVSAMFNGSTNTFVIDNGANYIEQLARTLCPD